MHRDAVLVTVNARRCARPRCGFGVDSSCAQRRCGRCVMAGLPAWEQLADRHLESPGQPADDQQPGIALSILNAGEVSHVNAGGVGKLLLGHPAVLAQLADSLAE